jgi:hypothetical protein
MEDINACTDFEMLEVKVPMIFLGTVGFSLRMGGRYCGVPSLPPKVISKVATSQHHTYHSDRRRT